MVYAMPRSAAGQIGMTDLGGRVRGDIGTYSFEACLSSAEFRAKRWDGFFAKGIDIGANCNVW